jgi:hypothetical protein
MMSLRERRSCWMAPARLSLFADQRCFVRRGNATAYAVKCVWAMGRVTVAPQPRCWTKQADRALPLRRGDDVASQTFILVYVKQANLLLTARSSSSSMACLSQSSCVLGPTLSQLLIDSFLTSP